MTDEAPEQEEQAVNATDLGSEVQPDIDYALAHIVYLANIGIEQSVTLFVGGIMVTGLVCSGRKYFEAAAAELDNANFNGPNAEDVRQFMKSGWISRAGVYPEPGDIKPELEEPTPAYIHLYHARYMVNGRWSDGKGLFWRGRLAQVDGYLMTGFPFD